MNMDRKTSENIKKHIVINEPIKYQIRKIRGKTHGKVNRTDYQRYFNG